MDICRNAAGQLGAGASEIRSTARKLSICLCHTLRRIWRKFRPGSQMNRLFYSRTSPQLDSLRPRVEELGSGTASRCLLKVRLDSVQPSEPACAELQRSYRLKVIRFVEKYRNEWAQTSCSMQTIQP